MLFGQFYYHTDNIESRAFLLASRWRLAHGIQIGLLDFMAGSNFMNSATILPQPGKTSCQENGGEEQMGAKPAAKRSATDNLGERPMSLSIGRQWRCSKNRETFETIEPGSGDVLAEVYDAGAEDLDAALEAARLAFKRSDSSRMKSNEAGGM
jgi:aldehyde dehydrogenase family protein